MVKQTTAEDLRNYAQDAEENDNHYVPIHRDTLRHLANTLDSIKFKPYEVSLAIHAYKQGLSNRGLRPNPFPEGTTAYIAFEEGNTESVMATRQRL